jgi:hypothetical protein
MEFGMNIIDKGLRSRHPCAHDPDEIVSDPRDAALKAVVSKRQDGHGLSPVASRICPEMNANFIADQQIMSS